jgi:hypothetical protein
VCPLRARSGALGFGARGAVAHPVHEFAETGSGLAGHRVTGMPKVVNVDAGQPGRFQRLAPLTGEVASPQLGTRGAGEDELVISGAGELVQVLSDIGQQEQRDTDLAHTGCRFRRPGHKCPVRQLDYGDLDPDKVRQSRRTGPAAQT